MRPQGVQRIRKLEDGDDLDINAADPRHGRYPPAPPARPAGDDARRAQDPRHCGAAAAGPVRIHQRPGGRAGQDRAGPDPRRLACCWPRRSTRSATPSRCTASARTGGTTCSTSASRISTSPGATCPRRGWRASRGGFPPAWARRSAMPGIICRRCAPARKLLLVLTDGAPADIDERDPQYLRAGCPRRGGRGRPTGHHAVLPDAGPARRCLCRAHLRAAQRADPDHVDRLPERLPRFTRGLTRHDRLYAGLTRT